MSLTSLVMLMGLFKFGKRLIGYRVTLPFHRSREMLQMHLCALNPLKKSASKSILTFSVDVLHYNRGEKNSVKTKKL